jgi:hypothetical protein
MALVDKQREGLISELGQPKLTIEFDVWGESKVSMWTHFDHSDNYLEVKKRLIAIRDHLDSFLKDEKMCPFHQNVIKF